MSNRERQTRGASVSGNQETWGKGEPLAEVIWHRWNGSRWSQGTQGHHVQRGNPFSSVQWCEVSRAAMR